MIINILKTLPWYFIGLAVLGVPAILLIISLFVLPDSESFFFGSGWVANIFILITTISLFEFFNWLYKNGISESEMLKTFNCGVGFCLIVNPKKYKKIIKFFSKQFKPYIIGKISKGTNKVKLNGSIDWI